MATPTTYTYSIATDFHGKINLNNLTSEIQASTISIALDHIETNGDAVVIYFKDALGSDDLATLVTVISNHDSSPSTLLPQPVTFQTPQLITPIPTNIGTRIWCYSHDFCDKTTWYSQAVRVVNEAVGTGDGATTQFNLAHPYVIDLAHGKVTDCYTLVPTTAQGGETYLIYVLVNGVEQTEQEFGFDGGDYTVDYVAGKITFLTAPPSGQTIVATYFYSPNTEGSSQYIIAPPEGKNYYITDVYVQCSINIVLTTTLANAIWVPNPSTGQMMVYPYSQTNWKRVTDLMNYTDTVSPTIPVFGGSPRGLTNPALQFHIEYQSPVELIGNYMMQIRSWTKYDIPLTGDFAVASYFGLSY